MPPRKGFEKVRSGCVTCKARRVKCDEARPACLRCRTGSRTCGGYRAAPPGSFSWNALLRGRPPAVPSPARDGAELRGLDFFRCVVAPALAGSPLGGAFWTRPVLQLAAREPAARHAVLAISALYERLDPSSASRLDGDGDGDGVALRHYNRALRRVATSTRLGADAVLSLSVLFTCVEFLRADVPAAVEHCRHGIRILGSVGRAAPPDVRAIFRHLGIFPFFFGATLADFPAPARDPERPGRRIDRVAQAAEALDGLMSGSVRLVRAFDPFRLGMADVAGVPCSLASAQRELYRDLDAWYAAFSAFGETVGSESGDQALLRMLEMRWHVCKIWVCIALCREEILCDSYRRQFERIVELARQDASSQEVSGPGNRIFFKFEMGLSPLLHFVVMKCRFLRLRLEALELLRVRGCVRESLWDATIMYAIGCRLIEREHGIEFPQRLIEGGLENVRSNDPLPSNTQRIRDSYLEEETQLYVDYDGLRVTRRRIIFFVRHEVRDEIVRVPDWIYLPEKSHG